jgi:DNA repair ATPase RecN
MQTRQEAEYSAMRTQYDLMHQSFKEREMQANELQSRIGMLESALQASMDMEVNGQVMAREAMKCMHSFHELVAAYREGDSVMMAEKFKGFADLEVIKRRKNQIDSKISELNKKVDDSLEQLNQAMKGSEEIMKMKQEKPKPEIKPAAMPTSENPMPQTDDAGFMLRPPTG